MHASFVSQWIRTLNSVDVWFDKAQAFTDLKKVDPAVLLTSRLAVDQLPLVKQIQIMSDVAKGCVARLTGQEPQKFEDDEKTFTDVRARVRRTIAVLESVGPDAFKGAGERVIPIAALPGKGLRGDAYLQQWAQPNFYFHATTAYAILRNCGVPLGKADFLGNVDVRDL